MLLISILQFEIKDCLPTKNDAQPSHQPSLHLKRRNTLQEEYP